MTRRGNQTRVPVTVAANDKRALEVLAAGGNGTLVGLIREALRNSPTGGQARAYVDLDGRTHEIVEQEAKRSGLSIPALIRRAVAMIAATVNEKAGREPGGHPASEVPDEK